MRGSLSRRWLMLKRANTDAKARTSARVRAVARPATTVAKARTPAKEKGAAAPREAHRPALQRQALPHQALQPQAEISASVHDSLQILICARNRFTGSWRGVSQNNDCRKQVVAARAMHRHQQPLSSAEKQDQPPLAGPMTISKRMIFLQKSNCYNCVTNSYFSVTAHMRRYKTRLSLVVYR